MDFHENTTPHFVIESHLGSYVIPVYTVARMATGRAPLFRKENLDEDVDIIRGILTDWLTQVHDIDPNEVDKRYLN